MPERVRVTITDRAVISALNTPGGAVYKWRDEIGREVAAVARANSPINDPLNAMHRGGEVGVYAASWDWDRRGSSGHHVVARVINHADHAVFVELGRSMSTKLQIFSWTEWGGEIKRIGGPSPSRPLRRKLSRGERAFNARIAKMPERAGNRTQARAGMHILSKAVVAVLGSQGIAARTDL